MGCGASKGDVLPTAAEGAPAAQVASPAEPAAQPAAAVAEKEVTDAGSVDPLQAAAIAQSHQVPVGDQVSQAATAGGVQGVLALMKQYATDAEFQWWCCDALASLCAGNDDNRATLYVNNGVLTILAAMRLFPWDENVQTKANWALANLAASYAEYIGKQGGVEAVVAGMKACPDAYQVQTSGTRCLQNLMQGSGANGVRAKNAGAMDLLAESLERNPEDGQLQWRGNQLMTRLKSLTEAEIKAANVDVARNSPWGRLRTAVFAGQARRIAAGNIPGLYGASAQVAAKAAEGIRAVVDYLRERKASSEVAAWCCDAIATLINGNVDNRTAAYEAGAVPLIIEQINSNIWEEEVQLKSMWALLALAPSYSIEIGAAGGISALVTSMYANKTNHQVQVAAIKLLSLLTLEPTKENVKRAQEASAIRVVKNVIQAHVDDGMLQYRGINLLERLAPGCTMSMPKVNLIRSASMQAEEMVLQARRSARTFTERNLLQAAGVQPSARVNGGVADEEQAALNAQAIREVDELAEAVEESGEENDDTRDKRRSSHKGAGAVASSSALADGPPGGHGDQTVAEPTGAAPQAAEASPASPSGQNDLPGAVTSESGANSARSSRRGLPSSSNLAAKSAHSSPAGSRRKLGSSSKLDE